MRKRRKFIFRKHKLTNKVFRSFFSLMMIISIVVSLYIPQSPISNVKFVSAASPTFGLNGAEATGTGAVTPVWPTHVAGDVALLFVESENQTITLSTPAGFTEITPSQGTGTPAAAGAVKLSVFWNRATSSAMANPTVADPGDHVYARIITFKGVIDTGNPYEVVAGSVKGTTSTTTTFDSVTTSTADDLIVLAAAADRDSVSPTFQNWVNTDLVQLQELIDYGTTNGDGGGIAVAAGTKLIAGSTGTTTGTLTTSITAQMTIALVPSTTRAAEAYGPRFNLAGAEATGTGAVTPVWPTHVAGDVALLFVESENQTITLSTPAGFTEITPSQGTGTPAAAGAVKLSVFWNRATSSAMANPTVADPGDHVYARILTFRGIIDTGDPYEVVAGSVKSTASTTTTFDTVTTSTANDLIVLASAWDTDSLVGPFRGYVNSNLTSIAKAVDAGTTNGDGGGIAVATGTKATIGATGTTAGTLTSSITTQMTIALKPAVIGCTSQVTSGNWNTAGTWNCGHVPTTGDDTTIRAGDTITMNVDSSVLGDITINGTLDTSATSYAINAESMTIASGGTLNARNSTISLSGTGTVFSNLGTYTGTGTSTIKLTNSSATGKTFDGRGGTYNNFWFAPGSGTGSLTISGSNTFADFKDDGTAAHSILFDTGGGTPPAIGDSYGGGVVAYILQSGDPGYEAGKTKGLIAATSNLGTYSWHSAASGLVGTSTALGTGLANTNAIIALYGSESNAAKGARDYTGGSYTDWYLPSQDELNKLYLNKTAIGGFVTTDDYWSSTEESASNAFYQEFVGGSQYSDPKDYDALVRPIRSFEFSSGITTTVTTWSVSGTSGNLITINSTTTSAHTLSKASGTISSDYLNIQHSIATGGATWYAGNNSVNNNSVSTAGSGWIFTPPPVTTCTSQVTTANWNSAGTWNCGHVPAAGENIVIRAGDTITMNVASNVLGTITINGTLNTSGTSYALSGTTLTIGASPAALTANASTITLSGTTGPLFTKGTGTFTADTSTVVFSGNATTTLNSGAITFNNLTSSGTGTKTLGAAVTIGGNLSISAGTFQPSTYGLSVTGTTSITGTLDDSSSTGTNLFTGGVTVNNGGTWTSIGNSAYEFRGGLTVNSTSTFTSGSGVYTFSTNAQTVAGTQTYTIASLTNSITTSTGLTLSGSTATITALTQGTNAILTISGTVPTITTLTATATGNTVNYSGTSQTLKIASYHHLTLSGGAETFGAITTVGGNLTLSGTATATTGAGLAIGGNLSIGNGTTFTMAGYATTVTGTTTVGGGTSGSLIISSATGTKLFTGLVTISANGTWNNSGNSPLEFRGGITTTPTFTGGSGLHTFSTNTQTLTGTFTIPSITTSVTLNNTNTLTVGTDLAGAGALVNSATGILNLGGTLNVTTLTATASGNTVNYSVTTGNQTIKGTTYHHLTLSNTSGTDTAGGALTVNGTLTTTSGGTLAMSTYQLLGASMSVTNGGTITTLNTTNPAIPTGKTWGGTVNFVATAGGQYVPAGTYGTLIFSNTSNTDTAVGIISTTNLTTTSGGTLDMSTYALTVTTPTNGGTLKTSATANPAFTTGKTWGGTVNFTATAGGQYVPAGTYGTLIFSNTSNTDTAVGIISTTNLTTTSGGTLDMNTYQLLGAFTPTNGGTILTGSITNPAIPSGKTWGGIVTFDATTGAQYVPAGTYGTLNFTNTSGTETAGGAITATTLTTTASGILNMGTYDLTATNITNNGTIRTQSVSATPLPTGKTWGGTVTYDATTGGQTIVAGTYGGLTLGNTSGTNTVANSFTATTLTTTASGILNMGTYDLTATNITNNGTIRTQSVSATPLPTGKTWGGTITYDATTGGQTIVAATSYNNLTLGNTSGTQTLGGAITIASSGTLAVSAGTFDPLAYLVTGSGSNTLTVASGATLRIGAGTFAENFSAGFTTKTFSSGSIVDYNSNGSQTILNTTYSNLKTSTGGTKTLAGETTVSGVMTIGVGSTLAQSSYGLILSGTTGTPFVVTGTLQGDTGTVTFTGNNTGGNTTIPAGGYNNILINNSSEIYVLGGNTTANATGTLTITAGTFDTDSSNNRFLIIGKISIADSSSAILNANSSSLILNGISGTLLTRGLNGVFNAGGSTVTMNGSGNVTVNSGDFTGSNKLYAIATINVSTYTRTLGGDLELDPSQTLALAAGTFDTDSSNNYSLTAGKISIANSATAIFNANNSSIYLNATSGSLFSRGSAGVFNAGGSTLIMNPNESVTLFTTAVPTVYNLTLSPVLTTDRTYTFGLGTTINGNLLINPSGSANRLTVTASSTITTATTKTTIVQGSGSASSTLSMGAYGLSTGFLDIESGGTLSSTSGTLTLTGTTGTLMTRAGTGVYTSGTSVVTINGAGSNVINSGTFTGSNKLYSLTLNASGYTKTLGTDLELDPAGTLTVTAGTFDTSSSGNYALSIGKIFIAGTASAIFNANNSNITLNGTSGTLFTFNSGAVFNGGTSTLIMNPDAAVTLFSNSGISINNLTLSPTLTTNRTYTYSYSPTINGNLLINPSGSANILTVNTTVNLSIPATKTTTIQGSGSASVILNRSTYTLSTGFLDIESGGTLSATSGALTLTGTTGTLMTRAGTGVYTSGTSVVTINGAGSNVINSGTFTGSNKLYSLTLNASGYTKTLGADLELDPAGTLTVTAGTFDTSSSGNYALTAGKISIASSQTFNANNSTITLNATSGILFTKNGTFNAGGSTFNISGNSDATINSGSPTFYNLTSSGTGTKTLGAAITLASSGTLNVSAGTFDPTTYLVTGSGTNTLTVANGATLRVGASTFAGNYSVGFTTKTFATGSTVDYFSSGAQTIDNTPSYSNLSTSTGGTKSLGGNTTATGAVTINIDSTLDTTTANNYTLNAGSLTINGGTFQPQASTVNLTGTGTVFNYTSGTITPATSTFKIIDTSSTGKTFAGGGQTYNNIWFTGTGTGEYTITGSNTFNDFKIDTPPHTVNFTNGTTTTVYTLTASGIEGNLNTLRSSTSGAPWTIVGDGANVLNYVAIADSTVSGSGTFQALSSQDLGMNYGWIFGETARGGGRSGSGSNGNIDTDVTPDTGQDDGTDQDGGTGGIVLPICSDTTDNDSDTYTDTNDSNCHLDGDLQKEYVPTWESETISPVSNTGGGQGDTDGDLGYILNKIYVILNFPNFEIPKFSILGMAINALLNI